MAKLNSDYNNNKKNALVRNEIILKIKVKPNSKKTEIIEKTFDAWQIKVAAPPVRGQANKELVSFLAQEFHVAKANIAIIKGEKSKEKIVKISQ